MIESLRLSWHIVVRNWSVYRKDFISNISPTIADPSLIMLSLGMGLGPLLHEVGGRSYLAFLAPGMVVSTALFTSFFESSYGFYVRMTFESVFKAMLTTPIGPREIVVGEFMWNFIKGAGMAFGVALFLLPFGLVPNIGTLFAAALVGGLTALPCAAIGLLSSSYVKNINQFQTVYSFVIAPIYFLSGVFFPMDNMPPAFRALVQISPFAHGVKLMQMFFWRQIEWSGILWHGGVLCAFGLALGLWSEVRIRQKLVT